MSKGSKAVGAFGYRLHPEQKGVPFKGTAIDLAGVPQLPKAVDDFWEECGHDVEILPVEVHKLAQAHIADAKEEINQRHLARLRGTRVSRPTEANEGSQL